MVATTRGLGKTEFVKEVLKKDDKANPQAVNDAWAAAGHDGTISTTLVQKVRSDMGLTGNLRSGRKPAGSNGSAARAAVVPPSRGRFSTPRQTTARTVAKTNGTHEPTAREAAPRVKTSDRVLVLTKLEGDIDAMLFAVKEVGGILEFEETLRKARRILARSHAE